MGWTYLDDGRVSTVTLDGVQLAAVSYDSAGQVSGVAYGPAGAPITTLGSLTRNAAGAVTGQTWTAGSRTLGQTFTRSQAGRVTRSVATDSAGPAGTVDWSSSYDSVGRLTSAVLASAGTRPSVTLGYRYEGSGGCGVDPAAGLNGSRTSMSRRLGTGTPAESTICPDNASRVTSVNSSTGGLTVSPATISYDAHGNLTQLGTQTWTYDGADRVSSTTANGIPPSLSVYVRDTLGRVVASGPTGSPTPYGFTSTDDSPDFQLTPTNTLRERYVTLPGGVLYTKGYAAPSLTSWAITNLHGDTIATITGTTVTAGYVYDPFGQPINTSSGAVDLAATPTTRTGTTTDAWHGSAQRGYEHSSGLNQILMGARTYLPDLGIFTATDPVEGGNTTTYTYPQDPINAQDLDGLGQRGRRRVKMAFSAEEQEFLKLSKQEQNLPENRALRNSVRQKTIANQKAAGTRNVAKRAPKGGGRAITSPKAAAVEGGGSSARSSGRGGTGGGALALFDFSGYLLEGGNIMSGRACHFYCLELFPISVAEMMPA